MIRVIKFIQNEKLFNFFYQVRKIIRGDNFIVVEYFKMLEIFELYNILKDKYFVILNLCFV